MSNIVLLIYGTRRVVLESLYDRIAFVISQLDSRDCNPVGREVFEPTTFDLKKADDAREVAADLTNGIHHFGQSTNISLSSTLFSQEIVYHALQSHS